MLALGQQAVGAQRASRHDHAARGEAAPLLVEPGAGALGRDAIAVAAVGGAERPDVDHLVLGQHLRTGLLGEPQVVLHQRVLRADTATHHARAATCAAGTGGPAAAEIRVGHLLSRRAEIDAHRRAPKGVFDTEVSGHLLQQRLAVAVEWHGVDAKHAFGGVVVGLQRGGPVLQPGPLRVDEELRRAAVQRAGIHHAAAADGRAAGDEHVLERRQPQDAAQTKGRRPHETAQVPGAGGVVLVAVAPAAFEHRDPIALFAQAQR